MSLVCVRKRSISLDILCAYWWTYSDGQCFTHGSACICNQVISLCLWNVPDSGALVWISYVLIGGHILMGNVLFMNLLVSVIRQCFIHESAWVCNQVITLMSLEFDPGQVPCFCRDWS